MGEEFGQHPTDRRIKVRRSDGTAANVDELGHLARRRRLCLSSNVAQYGPLGAKRSRDRVPDRMAID